MLERSLSLLALMMFCNLAAAQQVGASAPVAAPVKRWVYAIPIDESKNDEKTCALKWDRYIRSMECFAPYHNVNGTMKAGAWDHCTEYRQPASECPVHP